MKSNRWAESRHGADNARFLHVEDLATKSSTRLTLIITYILTNHGCGLKQRL